MNELINEFRRALDAHADGRLERAPLERMLHDNLARAPHLAAAHGACIEVCRRSGRIDEATCLALSAIVSTFQQAQSAPAAASAPPPADGGAAPEKTQLRAPGRASMPSDTGAEKTRFRAPRAAATPVPPAATASGLTGATGTGLPTGSRPTGSSWGDLSQWAAHAPTLGPGSIVKDRFVLEEELGRGGMGIVFKARDLRKEEAQDRNPYVAIKLLNDEFRRHPESLKALQRESRKAQQLAHANVVAVYDFDRDGANVFMVMELLEGKSLDRVIREHEETGLGVEQALRITRGLCRAMAYAHEQGVVHSDFKPANAFLTNSGVVKVFDFGIARAAKRTDHLATGSLTLFDPGTLGALTPTYASCEMIEGLEPDTRDDVYAIACVAYELLTGKHPFNRLSAVQARDKGMIPKRPRGLKRHQWRALRRGLAFNREERTASAQQFLNELLPRQRRPTVHIGVAAVLVIVLVVAATLVPSYLSKRREQALVETLAAGDDVEFDAVLAQVRALTPEQRAAVLLNDRARTGLIQVFERHINAATDPNAARVDYPRARQLLAELQDLLPDSLAVKDLEDRLIARENDEIKRLSDLFDEYLEAGLLIDVQGPQNVRTVLADIARVDAENRLLHDPRLPGAFAAQAAAALRAGDATLAQALIAAGLEFDPQDATLADLADQAARGLDEQARLARAQTLEDLLGAMLANDPDFVELERQRASINELSALAPRSPVLARVQQVAERALGEQTQALAGQGEHARALALVADNADLLSTSFIEQQRARLGRAPGTEQARAAAVAEIQGRLAALLAEHSADPAWSERFDLELRRLAAYLPAADAYVVDIKSRAANAYLEDARELRSAARLAEAARVLERARAYAPTNAALADEERLLAAARSERDAAAEQRNRLAQLDALKHKLMVQARANDVTEALASLQELRAHLPAADPFLTQEAPQAIGEAYLRLASIAARDGRYANAVTLAARAGEVAPSLSNATALQERYARYQAIAQALQTAITLDVAATRSELERLARADAGEAAAVRQRLARTLVERIRASGDAALVERLTAAAQALFPDQPILSSLAQPDAGSERPADVPPPDVAPDPEPATPAPQPAAPPQRTPSAASGAAQGAAAAAQSAGTAEPLAPRAAPDIPCTARLAGYGRRRQAVCYDTFDGGGRGPDLVVIPAMDGGAPYALGRTEVSNGDYAVYCARTDACTAPSGHADHPLTNITLDEAQRYLAWLSTVTGASYRLPTDAEWTHAAAAQGGQANSSSINCVVEIGGKKVRGVALEPVQSGAANAWGLYNPVGNAQEWALAGEGVVVRGGAYSDNLSACTPQASRPHSGAADAVTGLRVLREIE